MNSINTHFELQRVTVQRGATKIVAAKEKFFANRPHGNWQSRSYLPKLQPNAQVLRSTRSKENPRNSSLTRISQWPRDLSAYYRPDTPKSVRQKLVKRHEFSSCQRPAADSRRRGHNCRPITWFAIGSTESNDTYAFLRK